MSTGNLYFRRQFILSSVALDSFSSWKKVQIGKDFFLEAHPDLEITQEKYGDNELTLLGYFIDPYSPDRSNKEILLNLLQNQKGMDSLFEQTSKLSGRWIIISNSNTETIIFNDPGGLRSVYYTAPQIEPLCCASQPGLIARIFNYQYSNNGVTQFLNSTYYKNTKEYWWPSGSSLYDEINHLIPNHFLHLQNRRTRRFWPRESIKPISFRDGVERASLLLKKNIESASNRFDLAMTITAGIDTRTLLAGTKDISSNIYYYTLKYWGLHNNSPDIKIPKKLLSSLGIHHHVIDCSQNMDYEFRRIYMKNVDKAHEAWGNIAFGLLKGYPEQKICIKGNASEIARCRYYRYAYPKVMDGRILAKFAGMNRNNLAIAQFEKWLKTSKTAADDCYIDILDLFHWEHKVGSWQAMSQLEWDIVQEVYTPFNNRELLSILLSVNSRHRQAPRFRLHEAIIRNLWPDVLKEPINPQLFKYTLRPILATSLKKLSLMR